ncbi:MAG TPA: hypothetical protein VGN16_11505 [Acidobacteriaceae bacterium]|jgi:hypothetical protein
MRLHEIMFFPVLAVFNYVVTPKGLIVGWKHWAHHRVLSLHGS